MIDPSEPLPAGNRAPENERMEPDLASIDDSRPSELTAWKADLRRDFEAWLASLDEIPESPPSPEDDDLDAPDLHSFYAQFAAANAESRKANRRTAEAMSQWGEILARFESGLQPLRESTAQLLGAQARAGELSRPHCLMLVELLDRMHRLAQAFASPPAPTNRPWWRASDDPAWRSAWDAQRRALDILVGHLEGLLLKEGVARIETAGQPFDPAVMMAVAAEPSSTHPPQTVLEELAAGYLRRGELLRPAHVKVAR